VHIDRAVAPDWLWVAPVVGLVINSRPKWILALSVSLPQQTRSIISDQLSIDWIPWDWPALVKSSSIIEPSFAMRRSGVRPPSAPAENPDRMGIFGASGASLPDEFLGKLVLQLVLIRAACGRCPAEFQHRSASGKVGNPVNANVLNLTAPFAAV
jgi:hypothetical protein